ncbi:MAG: DNRLRE domain-containing protein, partial [Bacteroidetes bacterium]|nr:DNRLRE domain-containing protein [Bacteroidota bacterium]
MVSVYLQTQTTIVLQPGPEDGKDVLLSTLDPDLNLYYDPDFCAVSWTFQGEPYIYRSLIEFNLSAIPAGATIINASLYLSNNPNSTTNNGEHSSLSGSNESWLSRVTEEWGKYSVTWNNQPSVTEENRVYLPNTLDPHQDFEVDVRQLIQDMIDNPASGHGFMYKLANEDGYRCTIFASSDHPNPELR